MKLAPVNGVNVCELVFISEMDVFSTCFDLRTISGRCTAVEISYKHYSHLLTTVKSFVA